MEMHLDWTAIGAILALITGGFGVLTYVVRTEGGVTRYQVADLKDRVIKVENIIERLADFQGQLGVMQERLLATGRRQDEQDKRANELARRIAHISDDRYDHSGGNDHR